MTEQLVWTGTEEGVGDGTLEKESAQTLSTLNVPHLHNNDPLQKLNNNTSIAINILQRNQFSHTKDM